MSLPRTFGPVADLERHLPSDWWRHLFNSLYLKTDGDIVENGEATSQDIETIRSITGLDEQSRILDLCCGQGRHLFQLAREGFRSLEGLDRSSYLVRLARKRAKDAGVRIRFREGDARRFRNRDDSYDHVLLLGNSFGYFETATDDQRVLESVLHALRGGGTLVLDIADGEWLRENYQPRSWEWIDGNRFVCRERAIARDGERLISREVITHAEKGVIADQFYSERLYSGAAIEELLRRSGFEEVERHGSVSSASSRNEDLGMMARRLWITAQVPRPQVRVPSGATIRRVLVLLGDPTLPDPVKVNGQFNAEDLQTVAKLKEALGEVKDTEFCYVDRHIELVGRLTEVEPDLVMNLCDEGYRNDAKMELHVAALLEVYGHPYTGAGPACLAKCYDKALVRAVAQGLDIPVPEETFHASGESSASLPSTFPVLIKPNCGDSSLGITARAVASTSGELLSHVGWIRETYGDVPVLIQEFLSGREFSVGIIGNPGQEMTMLPILEVDYSALPTDLPQILGYESKWLPESAYWNKVSYREATLSEGEARQLADYSTSLFERLECRDYARFDFRAGEDGFIKLLEVNPNPGWCWDGKLNLMASFAGLSYAELLRLVLRAAQERNAISLVGRGHGRSLDAGGPRSGFEGGLSPAVSSGSSSVVH